MTGCYTKFKKGSLTDYSPKSEGTIVGFIPFPRVLAICEMQTASSRIWTQVVVSISHDDNCYTTSNSFEIVLLRLFNFQVSNTETMLTNQFHRQTSIRFDKSSLLKYWLHINLISF